MVKNLPESPNNPIKDEEPTEAEKWAQRVHKRSFHLPNVPTSELTLKAEVARDKEREKVEVRGERWFHPNVLLYGQGPKADSYRKEATEYFESQGTESAEGEKVLRFLKCRARYIDELNREPSAEIAQHAWEWPTNDHKRVWVQRTQQRGC